MVLKQYQVVLVNLDPTLGSEIHKTRPCLIISPNEMNKHLRTLIIAPLTSTSKAYPTRIEVQFGDRKGWIVLDQIRTIDKERVLKIMGKIAKTEINLVKSVIREIFVD